MDAASPPPWHFPCQGKKWQLLLHQQNWEKWGDWLHSCMMLHVWMPCCNDQTEPQRSETVHFNAFYKYLQISSLKPILTFEKELSSSRISGFDQVWSLFIIKFHVLFAHCLATHCISTQKAILWAVGTKGWVPWLRNTSLSEVKCWTFLVALLTWLKVCIRTCLARSR